MTKLTTESLEKFVNDIKTDGMCDITDHQVESALIQLLAYEQAADRPVGEIFRCSGNKTLRWWNDVPEGTVLYAAPVLPKQPELLSIGELLHRLEEQTGEKWVEESAQPVIPEQTERERIRREHAEWSDATFGNVGPVGPLKHLSKEALEAAADPSDPLEWADMQFLLWDAQRRMGLSDEFITRAMIEKLEINKKRQWPEPKDGEPRLHINTQSAQPVSNPYKFLGERAKYRVIIEGFSNSRSVDFEACSQEEAEEIGRDIFHEECNYGVERLESIPAQESE
ncbi:DUF550 domain-containing protein [Hafnia paralvei]|uniref:DUF550 domain-containing protein n=1 Tax=Hafnia paralvei TaxID=546367 RepID=UPI0029DBEDB6|nr:DUF550 domain-containing protein [Hafnia paralvei]MDX6913368.1 DUF550 domain-containing protein [Hafnia paralvei]